MEQATRAAEGGSGRWRRGEMVSKVAVPIVVAVVGALLVTALTPLGAQVREILFPTRAEVSGTVAVTGQGGSQVQLALDGTRIAVGPGGAFQLTDVGDGDHLLLARAPGAHPQQVPFHLEKGATGRDLGLIELEPLMQLGFAASVPPPSGSFALTVHYDVTLWLKGAPEDLGRVTSVLYALPTPLRPATVSVTRPAAGFCYRVVGTLPFNALFQAGGALERSSATVNLRDGQHYTLSAAPGPDRPPACRPSRHPRRHTGATGGLVPPPMPAPSAYPYLSPSPGPQPGSAPSGLPTTNTSSPARPVRVEIPDVLGMQEAQARAALERARLAVEVRYDTQTVAETGTVLAQVPGAGTRQPVGTTVLITVAAYEAPSLSPTPTPSPTPGG